MASLFLALLHLLAIVSPMLGMFGSAAGQDASTDGPRLVWTERYTNDQRARINSLPADPTSYANSGAITSHFYYQTADSQFVAIDGDFESGIAFWSESNNRTIFRGGLGVGTSGRGVFKGTSRSVEGLAVDWLAKNIYWTDSSYDWIMVSNYNATYFTMLIDTELEKPRGIATFPQRGYLFWTDWGDEKIIERSTLAGKNRTTIVSSNLHYPNGITVDYESERIYWVDASYSGNRIESCNLDGSNRTLLVKMDRRISHFYDLTIYQNNIFATDLTRQLRCIKKDTGTVAFSFSLGARPYGIMTYGRGLQAQLPSPCDSNPCEHLCTGAPDNSFQCLCSHGFMLAENGTSCILDDKTITKPQLMVVSRNEITRYPANFADLSEGGATKGKSLVSNKTLVVGIEMDARAEFMFFSDYVKKEIYRVRLVSGQPIKTVVGGVGSAEGLAVDWLNENLYWTDANRKHIAVAKYDGSRRKFLYTDNVIRPRSLVIHAGLRLLFWTEFGPPAQIERGNLDGSGRSIIKTGIDSPNGLAIDFKQDRLYYATRGNGAIEAMDFDGTQSTRIYTKARAKYFDIDIYKDYLFFTEWGSDNGFHAVSLTTKELIKTHTLTKNPYGIRMYDDSRQPEGLGVCDEDTCDHLCLPRTPEGFVCHCSIGYTLDADNVTCNVDVLDGKFVLVADTHIPGIFQISLEGGMERFTALPLEGLVRPIALAFDSVESRVYWTDVRLGSFSRAFLNGTGQETLGRAGIDGPDGMTIDPISRLLYWTDVSRNTVTVANLDGTHIKTLIDTDLDQPRAIVLDPVDGYMYYSDWGTVAKIEKAHMDGTNRHILVDTQIAWPNGLTLDLEIRKLYWADAKIDRIERINLDGTNREMIVDVAPRGHPYGIAVFGPHVYWSDWKKYGLMRADKTNGSGQESAGPQTFTRLSEIHVFNAPLSDSDTNACSVDNGGCSHLCLPIPGGRVCACPDGIELDQETSSVCITSNRTCPSSVPFGRFANEDCSYEPGRRCTVECDPGYWSESENYDVLCLPTGQWDSDIESFCTVITCPELNVTANATVLSCADPPIQNSTCAHECKLGYKWSSGSGFLTCEKDGTWSGYQLNCKAVTCEPLQQPANGLYRPVNCTTTGGRYADRCSLFCQSGFLHHQGVWMRSCQEDGRWTDEEIVSACIDSEPPSFGDTCPSSQNVTAERGLTSAVLDWPQPTARDNSVGPITYDASDTPPYHLEEGEHMITITAQDEANNTAECTFTVNVQVQYCDIPFFPMNGGLVGNCTYQYGSVCQWACNEGYRLLGSNTTSCDFRPDGQLGWLANTPQCEAVYCDPPSVDFTRVLKSGCETPYTPGAECTYMCAEGYHRVNGSSLRTCQDDGTWSGEQFYCHEQVCDPIAPFEHGIIQPESCKTLGGTVHNVCTLSCQDGFRYVGKTQHKCLETGLWQNAHDAPTCEDATAPHFNGTCPEDFTVIAPPLSTEAMATWDLPTAVDIHSDIYNLTSSHQSGEAMPEGTNAVVVTATDAKGNTATCRFYVTLTVVRCPEVLLPSNTHLIGNCSRVLGSQCTLGCRTGYTLSGADTKTCVRNGESEIGRWQWEGNNPVCQAITCPPIPPSQGMRIYGCRAGQNQPSPYNSRCAIICTNNILNVFMQVTRKFVYSVCQANGTWSGDFTCKDPTCPPLPLPSNARFQSNRARCTAAEVRLYTSCNLECKQGYRLRTRGGRANYRCMSSGRWSPAVPDTLNCRDISPPTFTQRCPQNYTIFADSCATSANVTYAVPMATDNGGNVTMKGPGDVMPMELRLGHHERFYKAIDLERNAQTCQVNIEVMARTCEALDQYSDDGFLRMESATCGNRYGSTVRFTCLRGSRMIGSRERTCQVNGQWSGSNTSCERITCPEDVELAPQVRMPRSDRCQFIAGSRADPTCYMGCSDGYAVKPLVVPICSANGTWSNVDDMRGVSCKDIMPPVFTNCPSSIRAELIGPNTSMATVTWQIPTATDNSGHVTVTGPDPPPVQLTAGAAMFSYRATDGALTSTCTFEVIVTDAEPPVAVGCSSEVQVIQADSLPVRIDHDEPMFDDNIGIAHKRMIQMYTRYRWVDSMAYQWGHTVLHHQALDAAGNTATCDLAFEVIQSTQCPTLTAPPNSQLSCDPSNTTCTLACNPGFYSAQTGVQTPLVYQCLPSGLWNHSTINNPNPFLPVCTPRETADRTTWTQSGTFVFSLDGACRGSEDQLADRFNVLLQSSSFSKACKRDTLTTCVISEPDVLCNHGDSIDGGQLRRKKRQASSNDVSSSSTAILSVDLMMSRGGTTVPAFISSPSDIASMWSSDNVRLTLTNMTAVFDPASSRLSGFTPDCGSGQVAVNSICVQCPPGTYQDVRSVTCEPCSSSGYQDSYGQLACKSCPSNKRTASTGAYLLEHCQETCPDGTYSYLGLGPDCLDCPVGTYQPSRGQRGCAPCTGNTTTSGPAATSRSACLDPEDITTRRTTTADDSEITPPPVTESNRPDEPTKKVTLSIHSSPAIVGTSGPETTDSSADIATVSKAGQGHNSAGKNVGKKPEGKGKMGAIIGVCMGILVTVLIVIILLALFKHRRKNVIPMTKFTNISIARHDESDDDEVDGAVVDGRTDGKYQQMQEMDDFNLEHLVTYGDDASKAAKRSSFSNALYESVDDPRDDRSPMIEPAQVWTTFDDESQT